MDASGIGLGSNAIRTGGNGIEFDFQAHGTGLPNIDQKVGNNGGGKETPSAEETLDGSDAELEANYEATTETQQTYESSYGNFDGNDVSLFIFGMLIAAAVYMYLKSRKN